MARFRGFVLFAEMRTGSNYLEAILDSCPGIDCHGEAFNPVFVGAPDRARLFGMDRDARDTDPLRLLTRMRRRSDGLAGFRFFHDHDGRAFDAVMADRRWAKVILTRDPVESYVSLKIAVETGQWRLTDPAGRRRARAHVDIDEFHALLAARTAFDKRLERTLQRTGQAAFRLDYADLGHREVVEGLLDYLGCEGRPDWACVPYLRQNPEPLRERVTNPDALDRLVTGRAPREAAGTRA